MKYEKGTFVVIPNTKYFKGKSSVLLSVFFWLIYHTDEDGVCYPSRKLLGEEVGVDVRTIDKYIKILENDGLIEKTTRKKKNSKENTSNLYQVLLPSVIDSPQVVLSNDTVTIPSINYTHITNTTTPEQVGEDATLKKEEIPYTYENELKKLSQSPLKFRKIIALYFLKKNLYFENSKQFWAEVIRCSKVAKTLEGYDSSQLSRTMDYCEEKWGNDKGWSINAVAKQISNVVNKK
jgi:hypothetical protein